MLKYDEKTCPRCAEVIKKAAAVCKHCGHEFSATELDDQRLKDKGNTAMGCIALGVIILGAFAMCSRGGSTADNAVASANSTSAASTATPSPEQAHDQYVAQLKREIASLEGHPAIPEDQLASKEGITIQTALIGVWDKLYIDGADIDLSPDEKAMRAKFKRLLSAEQARRFPKLRAAQAKIFDAAMWEANVDVAAVGSAHDDLRLTGAIFAANTNVKQGFESLQETLHMLRFKRATFEWYRGSDNQYYKLDTPKDTDVAALTDAGWSPASE